MNILFYSPFNQRSRDTESLMLEFKDQGHEVFSLSQAEGESIHPFLKLHGICTHSHVLVRRGTFRYFWGHIIFFIRFCRKNDIDIVYSHLEPANFVASVAQYFIKAKVFICRHHVDEASLYAFDKSLFYWLTYKLARNIIVVSATAARFVVEREGVSKEKVIHIDLGYNFSLFPKPNSAFSGQLRSQLKANILLLTACRLTRHKRADLSICVLERLLEQNFDVKLILLGSGEEESNIRAQIDQKGLNEKVIMPGYVSNIIDYMSAADFLLHPSILESSCVVVKEAGIARLPVIVCGGVGDFDDYVVHERNGFVLDRERFVESAAEIIVEYQLEIEKLDQIRETMSGVVTNRFDVKKLIRKYEILNQ